MSGMNRWVKAAMYGTAVLVVAACILLLILVLRDVAQNGFGRGCAAPTCWGRH